MGYRGSKSDSFISVKEQRADGSSIFSKYCKVCSESQGNLVFIHQQKDVNTVISTTTHRVRSRYTKNILCASSTNIIQKSLFSTNTYSQFPQGIRESAFNTSPLTLNPNYVTGFTDGEGCFFVGINQDVKFKTGYRVKATFQIGLHEKDLALLEQIRLFFGVGKVTKLGAESVQYRVSGLDDLNTIIYHFDNYPLLTRKHSDYIFFKEVINLMKQGKHLTLEGLNRIVSIKSTLNNGELSDSLNLAFPNLKPALRSEVPTGFTDAEGCFFIALKKSPASKLDKELLESLIQTLNCGRYIVKPDCGEFIVEKFTDVRDKIIPIFEKFKLRHGGAKSLNYEDFKKAALLIGNKAHLTREGLDEIKKIKVILLSSGATITYAHHSLIKGERKGALYGSIFTVLLALIFTFFQGVEYSVSSFTISDGVFGTCFFFGTGFHGFHVIIGTIFLSVAL
ncbi:unnamed protein product [Fusarium graminearum]|nr:unnamed protein product [Fusarium graminearum]